MIQYIDMTKADGCFGVIPENGETIVFTGVSINSMPLSVKRKEGEVYADFAKKYGVRFIFEDDIPDIDFYSVPRLDIGAKDDVGGFIASVTEPFSLSDPISLVYISPDRQCYLITQDATEFLSIVSEWKSRLVPFDGVALYTSKEKAKQEYEIIDFEKTKEYQDLKEMINRQV